MSEITFGAIVNGFTIEHISKIDETTGIFIGRRPGVDEGVADLFVVSTFVLGASEWNSGHYTKNFGKAVEEYTDMIMTLEITEDCE